MARRRPSKKPVLETSRTPTREQQRCQARESRRLQEAALESGLRALPKGKYCQLAGRQQKVIDEQGRRHQLPVLGPTVDLFDAVKRLHDILAKHSDVLADGEQDLYSEKIRGQIEHLRTRKQLLDLEIAQRQDTLVERAELEQLLNWWTIRLKALGELLGRRYGREAQQTLNDFLTRAAEEATSGRRQGAKG